MLIRNVSIYLDVENLKNKQKTKESKKKGSLKLSYEKLEAKNSLLVKRFKLQFHQFLSQLPQQEIISRKS